MRVLQFAFGGDAQAATFLPHAYTPRSVAYTGTHDNDTIVGWFEGDGAGPGMNSPGAADGNWQWRLPGGAATAELARRVRALAVTYGRSTPQRARSLR